MLGGLRTEEFFTVLRSLNIRLPNPQSSAHQYVTVEEAISQEILQRFFRQQYHTDNNVVEFIPRYIRPFIDDPRFFYKSEARPTERDPKEKSKNPVQTAGFEHELLVQDKFESLEGSPLFSGNTITIFHNMKKDFLKFNKLKKFMNNEYDLVVFDAMHGVFVVETKRREHAKFTGTSLERELGKQQKRKEFLCAIKDFLGIEVPITPVILTSLIDNEDRLLAEHDHNSYVLGVNFNNNFDETWKFFLDTLTDTPTTFSSDDIERFAATLDALLHCGDTPSQLHTNLTGGSVTTPGDYQLLHQKKRNIVIWTKQQRQARDLIQDTLSRNADEYAGGHSSENHCQTTLKLLISGCFGSGKTLMLTEAAKFFCGVNENPARKVAYVIFDMQGDTFLLAEQLQASFEAEEVTKGRFRVTNVAGYTPQNSCCQFGYIQSQGTVDLILLDEYFLDFGPGLICSGHDSVPNIIITTRYKLEMSLWETKLGKGFTQLELNGNIRSGPSICKFISEVEKTEVWAKQIYQDPVALTVDHNVRGRSHIEEIDLELDHPVFGSYLACHTIVSKIESIQKNDTKECIYVITNTVKDSLQDILVPELNKLGVVFGNVRYFFGCEASTVIYIGRKKDDVMFARDDAISRASVNLIVFNLVETVRV